MKNIQMNSRKLLMVIVLIAVFSSLMTFAGIERYYGYVRYNLPRDIVDQIETKVVSEDDEFYYIEIEFMNNTKYHFYPNKVSVGFYEKMIEDDGSISQKPTTISVKARGGFDDEGMKRFKYEAKVQKKLFDINENMVKEKMHLNIQGILSHFKEISIFNKKFLYYRFLRDCNRGTSFYLE